MTDVHHGAGDEDPTLSNPSLSGGRVAVVIAVELGRGGAVERARRRELGGLRCCRGRGGLRRDGEDQREQRHREQYRKQDLAATVFQPCIPPQPTSAARRTLCVPGHNRNGACAYISCRKDAAALKLLSASNPSSSR